MRIGFLHTAEIHVPTFDRLLDAEAPGAARDHRVEPDWLARGRRDGLTPALSGTVADALLGFAAADAVVCTCSTLGPIADSVSAPHVFRVDRPMMDAAVLNGPDILVALCLESTVAPTLALLGDAAERAGLAVRPEPLLCAGAWAHFEAGDARAFARAIADAVEARVAAGGRPGCVVLAQASMAVAEPLLEPHGLPVLSSPRLAVRHAVGLAARSPAA